MESELPFLNIAVLDKENICIGIRGVITEQVEFAGYDPTDRRPRFKFPKWSDYQPLLDIPKHVFSASMYLEVLKQLETKQVLVDSNPPGKRKVVVKSADSLDELVGSIENNQVDVAIFSTNVGEFNDASEKFFREERVLRAQYPVQTLFNYIMVHNLYAHLKDQDPPPKQVRMIITPIRNDFLINLESRVKSRFNKLGYTTPEFKNWIEEVGNLPAVELVPKNYSIDDIRKALEDLFQKERENQLADIGGLLVEEGRYVCLMGPTGVGKSESVGPLYDALNKNPAEHLPTAVFIPHIVHRIPRAGEVYYPSEDDVISNWEFRPENIRKDPSLRRLVGTPLFLDADSKEDVKLILESPKHKGRFAHVTYGPDDMPVLFDHKAGREYLEKGYDVFYVMAGVEMADKLEELMKEEGREMLRFGLFAYRSHNKFFFDRRIQNAINGQRDANSERRRKVYAPTDYDTLFENSNRFILIFNRHLREILPFDPQNSAERFAKNETEKEVPSIELQHHCDLIKTYFELWRQNRWPVQPDEFYNRLTEWHIQQFTGHLPLELQDALQTKGGKTYTLKYHNERYVGREWATTPNIRKDVETEILGISFVNGRWVIFLKKPSEPLSNEKQETVRDMLSYFGKDFPCLTALKYDPERSQDYIEPWFNKVGFSESITLTYWRDLSERDFYKHTPGVYVGKLHSDLNIGARIYPAQAVGVYYVFVDDKELKEIGDISSSSMTNHLLCKADLKKILFGPENITEDNITIDTITDADKITYNDGLSWVRNMAIMNHMDETRHNLLKNYPND